MYERFSNELLYRDYAEVFEKYKSKGVCMISLEEIHSNLIGEYKTEPKTKMKNKIEDLRNHLFEQLERLNDEEGFKNPLIQEREINRTSAIVNIANALIDTARAETEFLKVLATSNNTISSSFIINDEKKIPEKN